MLGNWRNGKMPTVDRQQRRQSHWQRNRIVVVVKTAEFFWFFLFFFYFFFLADRKVKRGFLLAGTAVFFTVLQKIVFVQNNNY